MLSVVGVSDSVCARTPVGEQIAEVCAVDFAVRIHIRLRESRVDRSPEREQHSEVCTVNLAVDEQICEALARVRNAVCVEITVDIACIADSVMVTVGLVGIQNRRAVVDRIRPAITVRVRQGWLNCDERQMRD